MQFRLPIAAAYNSRINANASTTKDGRMVNCFTETASDNTAGKKRVYAVKRPGWGVQTTLASGSKGTAIVSWTGQGGGEKVIAAYGSTNSTIYDSVNGLFVAVSQTAGTANQVMTSPDGITWTARTSASDSSWTDITYGNGLFVAISNAASNAVMTSPDGITWTSRTSVIDIVWADVTYANGVFVAVGTSGTGNRVMTSANGITWTSRTSAADNSWNSVVYGNGIFVAVASSGTGNRVMTSPDGITWTIRTSAADNAWRSVTYGNGLFVAASNNVAGSDVMTSPDGITWTARTSIPTNGWQSVKYGNGLFVAVSTAGTSRVMTSTDGITWTSRTSAAESNSWVSSEYGNGLFVAVSAAAVNSVMTSADGITWTSRTASGANSWTDVVYGTTNTSLGAITGEATGITETILSGAPTLAISSSDSTGWNTSSDAVTGALTFTGNTTSGSAVVTTLSSTSGLVVGQAITGTGIPASTRILSIDSATQITMNANATATNATVTITRTILGKIIDTDFPGNASKTLAGTFAHIDGFACIMDTTGALYASDLNSVTGWTANSFDNANAYPDKGVGCVRFKNFIMAFGKESVQFFYNAGLTPFPLAKAVAMTQKVGAISADAIASISDTIFWAGSTAQGGLSIFQFDGSISRISNPEIDAHLIVVGTARINMTAQRVFGRSFVIVNAGSSTYRYCIEEKSWSEDKWTTRLAYKVIGVSVGGTLANYCISNESTSGKLYLQDHANLVFVDDAVAYTARAQLQNYDGGTNKRKFYSRATLICDREPVTSTTTLLYTDDDYASEVTAGTFDLSEAKPRLTRLGSSDRRAWILENAANTAMRVEALELEAEAGTS